MITKLPVLALLFLSLSGSGEDKALSGGLKIIGNPESIGLAPHCDEGDGKNPCPGIMAPACEAKNDDSCVRVIGFEDGKLMARFASREALSSCPMKNGIFYSNEKLAQCHENTRSAEEIKGLLKDVVYPAVKKAVEAFGLSTSTTACNLASSYAVTALRLMGVKGATVREGAQHAFVQIPTKEGAPLIFDPTMAQFLSPDSDLQKKASSEGFAGTQKELEALIEGKISSFKVPAGWTPIPSDLPKEDAKEVVRPYVDHYRDIYFTNENDDDLKTAADAQIAFYERHDTKEVFKRKVLFSTIDSTKNTRAGFRVLLDSLGDRVLPAEKCQ